MDVSLRELRKQQITDDVHVFCSVGFSVETELRCDEPLVHDPGPREPEIFGVIRDRNVERLSVL